MNDGQTQYAVTRLYLQQDRLISEIKALRAAGADFIVAYPHWDKEHKGRKFENAGDGGASACLRRGCDLRLASTRGAEH